MKLSVKSAWMCASGAFLVTAMPAFVEQVGPMGFSTASPDSFQGMVLIETTVFSLMGALIAGAIGYIIGDILANPQGAAKKAKPLEQAPPRAMDTLSILTDAGNETFLDDLSAPITLLESSEPGEITHQTAEPPDEPTKTV